MSGCLLSATARPDTPKCETVPPTGGQLVPAPKRILNIMPDQQEAIGAGTNGAWHIEIATPDGTHLHPTATLVELSTTDGQIGVMPGHGRLLTVLDIGELVIHNGRQRDTYLVGGGFARITPERLSVLAFSLERNLDEPAWRRCESRQKELEN